MFSSKYLYPAGLSAIIFSLLITYPIQVVSSSYAFSYALYAIIFLVTLYMLMIERIDNIVVSTTDKILILYLFLMSVHLFEEYFFTQSIVSPLRIAVIYTLPILFYYTLLYNKRIPFKPGHLIHILLFFSVIIGIESYFSFFQTSIPSWYEQQHFNYVYMLTGEHLFQLLGPLRKNGLMDHIHVTSLFIAFGFLTTSIIYTRYNGLSLLYGLLSVFLFGCLVAIGVRLTLISAFVFLTIYIVFFYRSHGWQQKKIIIWLIFLVIHPILLLIFSFEGKLYFWSVIYLQYVPDHILSYFLSSEYIQLIHHYSVDQCSIENFMTKEIVTFNASTTTNFVMSPFWLTLFGTGFGTLSLHYGYASDDFFIAQLYSQLGTIGILLLIFLSATAIRNAYILLQCQDQTRIHQSTWIALGFIALLLLSLIHSGVFLRKSAYPLFFMFVIMLDYLKKHISSDCHHAK